MHPLILLALYLAITLAPLALAGLQDKPPRPLFDEIASGLAMTAFAILLVEFVLSGRIRAISARIGMDVTMRFHQLLARTALVFALIHPFFYRTPMFNFPHPWDVSGQLTLGLDMVSLVTGLIAWILLPVFVAVSIFRDDLSYRYETWRAIHVIGAVVIAVMLTHHTLAAGRYSSDPMLAGFWLALLGAALGSVVWTYFIAPFGASGRPYQVSCVRNIALKTWELTLHPTDNDALVFDAGQFAWLKIGGNRFSRQENPFSISSAPDQRPNIRFVIKEVGDMTRSVGAVHAGTVAYLDGAYGNLTLKGRDGTGIALIAGGVGIAPLLSIARQLEADQDNRPVVILYGNRVAEQIVYPDELAALARSSNCRVEHVLSEPAPGWKGLTGIIDKTTIDEVFDFADAPQWLYLVCGPPPMLKAVEDALYALGIPARQIVSERFYYD